MSFKAALFASPIVLLADFALLGGAANAEATFQPNSDILGVKLSMTADEAIKYLKANFITSEVTIDKPRPVTLTSPGQAPIAIPTDIIIGYEITVTPKAEQAANAVETADLNKRVAAGRAAGFGQLVRPNPESADLVRLNVNPGNPQEILAIKRTRVYRPEDQPLKTVFMEAVEQKYGKPVLSGREGFDADAPAASGCSDYCAVWSSVVLPPARAGRSFAYYECDKVDSPAADLNLGSLIVQLTGYQTAATKAGLPKCQIYMQLGVHPGKSGEYVGQFSTYIADTQRTVAAVEKFYAGLNAAANTADRKRIEQDTQKKPRL